MVCVCVCVCVCVRVCEEYCISSLQQVGIILSRRVIKYLQIFVSWQLTKVTN